MDSIENNCKILMDYGKLHVIHDMTIFYVSLMPLMHVATNQIIVVHRKVGIMLEYLNCHEYNAFVVFFIPLGSIAFSSDFLVHL